MAEFVTNRRPDAAILVVAGDLDIASEVELVVRGREFLASSDVGVVELDLGGVTFIDSSGLGALVRLHKLAQSAGRRMVLANVPPRVARVLSLTGLSDLFAELPER